MRIVLNNLTAIRQRTGIGHYVTELLRHLRTDHEADQFATFPGPWVEGALARLGSGRKRLSNDLKKAA